MATETDTIEDGGFLATLLKGTKLNFDIYAVFDEVKRLTATAISITIFQKITRFVISFGCGGGCGGCGCCVH